MSSALRSYFKLDNPNLPVLGDLGTAGLPVAQFVDLADISQEKVGAAGEVMETRDLFLPTFSMRAFDGIIYHDALLVNEEENGKDFLASCFFLESKAFTVMPGLSDRVNTFNKSHNFKFDPYNEMQHCIPANNRMNFIHFSYKPDFLRMILPDDERWSDKIHNHLDRKIRLYGKEAKYLSPGQERALQNIFDCPLQGKWAQMMIESSFVQLILLQMQALFKEGEYQLEGGIQKQDLEIIHAVRDHLANTFLEDHSIVGLARHFGTNSNKLMTLFKRAFGKSVFEYLTDLRMDYAGRLLREENRMVVEVAYALGYKNPHHFSTAFKRKFGMTPSEFK